MKKKRNRRTLKKRIRRIISLSTFMTVAFLSGVIIFLIIMFSKSFAENQVDFVSSTIQHDIDSGAAIKSLRIKSINEIDSNNPDIKRWVEDLKLRTRMNGFFLDIEDINKVCINIKVRDKLIYSDENNTLRELANFYSDAHSEIFIPDSSGKEVISVTVSANPEYMLALVIILILIIMLIGLAAMIISNVMSRFLVIPIITPLRQLETKVKAIAEGDHETAVSTEIILKKPLREIESLADSTNGIMSKLKSYNEILESQKEALENQNTELEAQNEELVESKLEIQKQQAQLVQSEKMASVGLLTAAITHEINTPIGAINSNAQIEDMLLNELISNPVLQANEELKLMIGQLKEVNDVNLAACSRIIEIIKSLKTYSRLDQADFQEADINEGIRSVLVLTNNLLKRRIAVHEEFGDIPKVKCFPGQLNQVFMNIIVNASQAIEGEGEIFISTYQQKKDIFIKIKDTGTGIKEENLSKIFDPGFTTKGVGVGLGLGLYISYNIIQNHKGEISVASEPGKGTEVINS